MVKYCLTILIALTAVPAINGQATPPKAEPPRCKNGFPVPGQCSVKDSNCPRGSTCNILTNTCCFTALPLPKPVCPLSEVTGSCGGFGVEGKECQAGSRCIQDPFSDLGTCCRIKVIPPKPGCPLAQSRGTCGGVVGKQCPKGYDCIYHKGSTLGTCCKSKVLPPKPMCPLSDSKGECGGVVGKQCPTGYKCIYHRHSTLGTCCRSKVIPPKPACPLTQIRGSCGGVVGKQCPKGYDCVYSTGSTLGTCCRSKVIPPKPACPLTQSRGTCGGVVGKRCPTGYDCIYPTGSTLGTCCRSKVIPPKPVCPLSQSKGECGGFVGKQCPTGYKCIYHRQSTLGTCCRSKDTYPRCSSGYIKGTCGLKKRCQRGFYCQYPYSKSPFTGALGRCCQRKKPDFYPKCASGVIRGRCGPRDRCPRGFYCQNPRFRPYSTSLQAMPPFLSRGRCCQIKNPTVLKCPRGQTQKGRCGGKIGIQCSAGYKCVNNPFIVDGYGICCGKQIVHPGICPKPSPRFGICLFDPARNCLGDEACPKGYKCCSEGCGRVCKRVIGLERPDLKPAKPLPRIPDIII